MMLLEMLSWPFMQRALTAGVLVSLCAALLGVPLVLKRYSMIGDGLSHVSFGALAVAAAQDLYKTLRYLNEKEGMAVVMVTHDLRAALENARTVLHIGGRSWFYGTVEDYYRSPEGRRFRKEET